MRAGERPTHNSGTAEAPEQQRDPSPQTSRALDVPRPACLLMILFLISPETCKPGRLLAKTPAVGKLDNLFPGPGGGHPQCTSRLAAAKVAAAATHRQSAHSFCSLSAIPVGQGGVDRQLYSQWGLGARDREAVLGTRALKLLPYLD